MFSLIQDLKQVQNKQSMSQIMVHRDTLTYHKVNNAPNRIVRFISPSASSPLICFPTDCDGSSSSVIGTEEELHTIFLFPVLATTHDDEVGAKQLLTGLMVNALRGCATNAFVDDTTRRDRNAVYFMIDYETSCSLCEIDWNSMANPFLKQKVWKMYSSGIFLICCWASRVHNIHNALLS